MPRKQSTAARKARAYVRATEDAKYTETLRDFTTTPTTDAPPPDGFRIFDTEAAGRRLAAALRRADMVEFAEDLEATLDYEEPEDQPFDSGIAYDNERKLISGATLALAEVAARPGVLFLAEAAADLLENCYPDFTADAVRGMELPLQHLPRCRPATAAKEARRAIRALAAATDVPHGGDHEWHACKTLLDQALLHAHKAATGNDRDQARSIEPVPLLEARAELRQHPTDHHPAPLHIPETATATRCTGCGEIRISPPGQHTDPWHGHQDEQLRLYPAD
ncbi:hypothetical protein FHX81_0415 [Saccharothrix saharensis]|uniref:Uncharacterized protein n=1 Tax=Saccharothrix saharensis TaxID=571190 RepID=A0A543J5R3_9PSEU|nr:hypothetical protein [Saccharothrix saharensis]TQM78161.1 hypothetical protein FHX81_0415 [Saccharothrix saharensis]